MDKVRILRMIAGFLLVPLLGATGLSACNPITAPDTTASSVLSTAAFAGGTKGVKINTFDSGLNASFGSPGVVPTPTVIPPTYPGADGTTTYLYGVSPTQYYALDGTTATTQPAWLLDFQLGITNTASGNACATFGGVGALDALNFYRTSEKDCATTTVVGSGLSTGVNADPIFARIILNRDPSVLGTAENLMIQVEYQASGLHLNSDGSYTNAEDNLDQLWKVFWSSSLASLTPSPFSVFIPPNYGACKANGTGPDGPGSCQTAGYKGAPTYVRQIIVPLSAYPSMKVIQISRVKSRINSGLDSGDVATFCNTHDSPLCLGVVIRSVTLMRL